MKNKKGITLVSLIITIVVMIIISGTTVSVSYNRFKANNVKKMLNDIQVLNDKIDTYYLKYGDIPILKQNGNGVVYTYSSLDFDKDADDNENYYIVDLELIGNVSLTYGEEGYRNPNTSDDVYIINEKSHTVYYVKGIEYTDGVLYHSTKLSDSANANSLGPTKPEIKILSKNNNEFEVEIIPGKDKISGILKTEYNIKTTDIENNVNQTGNTEISDRTVISNLSGNKAHEITAVTTSNDNKTSTNTLKINEWIEKLDVGDLVDYETELAKTENAVNSTKKAELISDLGTYSGNTDTSQNTDSSVVRDSLTWKVLDVKDGKIRLISTVPTTSKIRLYGENGYNNAVYLIDKACDTLYSIDGIGKAQNLKIEDIEGKINTTQFDYTQYANSNVDTGKYGGTKEYTSNLQYPKIYASEIGCKAVATADNTGNTLGLSEQTSSVTGKSTATNRLKTTQTYWYNSMASTDFTDSKYYTLFINNGSNLETYWLSSRCVYCYSNFARFFVRRVYGGGVGNYHMFDSCGNADGLTCAFRPVVTLSSDVKIGDKVDGVWQMNS